MRAIAFGGGWNSPAMVIGAIQREIAPVDLVTFADTGGELPRTYDFVHEFSDWMVARGWPEIVWVQNDGMYKTLENNCREQKMLPSLAYGFKSCSDKYKRRPQEKYTKSLPLAQETWAAGEKIVKWIGFHAGEFHRAKIPEDDHYRYEYPLVDWEWDQKDCLRVVRAEGFEPGKSSCFFCPARRKPEIKELAREHPELFQRAVEMERNADLTSVKGLGRSYSWEDYIKADSRQQRLFPEMDAMPCFCFDGGSDDD